jgi:hypothetical protein
MTLSVKLNTRLPTAEDREASFRAKLIGTTILVHVPQKFFPYRAFALLALFAILLVLESFNLTPLRVFWWSFFVDIAVFFALLPMVARFIWIYRKRQVDFYVEANRYRVIREGDKFHAHIAPTWKFNARARRIATLALVQFPDSICSILPNLFIPGISCISIVSPWLIDEERMDEFLEKMTALLPAGYCIHRLEESRLDLLDSLYARLPFVGVPAWRKRKDGWRLRAIGIEIRRQ